MNKKFYEGDILPRFDNEGFNPEKRISNDARDRSVPEDENYYSPDNELEPPVRSFRQQSEDFSMDILRDFDRERRDENERDASQRRENKPKRNPRGKRKLKTGKKILLGIIAIILALILITVGTVNGVLGKINYDEKQENQYVQSSELKRGLGVKNILLLGVDARKNQDAKKSHPDSMMLISIDSKHGCLKMISFLRDSWVYIPSKGHSQRLNTACQENGYSGAVDAIEYNFGVDIDGYVVTDFEMFKAMVDSIGGVEIEVSEKEAKEVTSHPKRYGNVTLEAGKHTLTGEQALAYSRIRKIDTDFMRAKRQRTVINAILNKVKTNPLRLLKLANASAPYLETDLSKSELKKIAIYAMPCLKGERTDARVPFDKTWEYANINGASVIKVDADKNKEMLIEYIYEKSAEEILAEEEK